MEGNINRQGGMSLKDFKQDEAAFEPAAPSKGAVKSKAELEGMTFGSSSKKSDHMSDIFGNQPDEPAPKQMSPKSPKLRVPAEIGRAKDRGYDWGPDGQPETFGTQRSKDSRETAAGAVMGH